jgi:hypothetical protein
MCSRHQVYHCEKESRSDHRSLEGEHLGQLTAMLSAEMESTTSKLP